MHNIFDLKEMGIDQLKELGADVVLINNVPNGTNINENCGSAHMEGLMKFVASHRCDFGLAMNGDGDYLLACDQNGNPVSAERISELCQSVMEEKSAAADGLVTAVTLARVYKESNVSMSKLSGNE